MKEKVATITQSKGLVPQRLDIGLLKVLRLGQESWILSSIRSKNECEDPLIGLQGGAAQMDLEMGEEGRER